MPTLFWGDKTHRESKAACLALFLKNLKILKNPGFVPLGLCALERLHLSFLI